MYNMYMYVYPYMLDIYISLPGCVCVCFSKEWNQARQPAVDLECAQGRHTKLGWSVALSFE